MSASTTDNTTLISPNSLNSQPATSLSLSQTDSNLYYGLAGEIVKTIEPYSEADPVAINVQLLAGFGNIIGKKPHFRAEDDIHSFKINPVLVGDTSKGRKGVSWSRCKHIYKQVATSWVEKCITTGLSSAEGLIWAIRDPIGEEGRDNYDPGVDDKRILVIEPEFATILRRIQGQGNTLSAIIRQAWDSDVLRAITKHSPAKSTGAHVTIIGHITKDELIRYLDSTEMANGFANRYIWIKTERSKLLPEGGSVPESELRPLITRVKDAIDFATNVGEMRRDDEAKDYWAYIYRSLSEGSPGMVGSLTARAEPYTMRLAGIYALLDRSAIVRIEHLKAGAALWNYSVSCVKQIFGTAIGDPIADTIYRFLIMQPDGLTRTQIHNLFAHHQKAAAIDRALQFLHRLGRVKLVVNPTPGRSEERWYATAK